MRVYRTILVLFLVAISCNNTMAQETAVVSGRISDNKGRPLELVNISIEGTSTGTVSDDKGNFSLNVPASISLKLVFSSVGYETKYVLKKLNPGKNTSLNIVLSESTSQLDEVEIREDREKDQGFTKLKMREVKILTSISGDIESYLKTLPGVNSNNEMSSQYSVRGGNFDENLIYINGIEVYRPFLIRAGKQEGLSIVNSDLVSSVHFSAGGFNASYGDKMASVLDIRYRKPEKTGGGFELGLLGASGFFEGVSANNKLSWIIGSRYKSNQYMLNSMDTEGDYKPRFADVQSYITYQANNKLSFDLLGNIAINHYDFIPQSRRTSFGTLVNSVQLYVLFNGQELDKFNTYLGAFSANYRPNKDLALKFTASAFSTLEHENYDIEGYYSLNELDRELGSESLGDSIMNIGLGRFIDHARNYLQANVITAQHRGSLDKGSSTINWGLKIQNEIISDRMNEWKMVDSAGYSIPYDDSSVRLVKSIQSDINLNSIRTSGFILIKNSLSLGKAKIESEAGIRAQYWSFNKQFLLSPRFSLTMDPDWNKDIKFRIATGIYYQPAFYKELKSEDATINHDLKAQKSVHLLAGSTYDFSVRNRPFKFSSDIYYKSLKDIIPYKIDNVRIVYSGKNNAEGYATGLDFKINGEFVKGVESWASLSLMQTRERLTDGSGSGKYYPRPTDQLVSFSIFFQDYFPTNPTFKVYLALHYSAGLPVSPPRAETGENYFRMPAYRRMDLGFSKILKDEDSTVGAKGIFSHFKTTWIALEILNLADINNTISYTWIQTVNNLSGQTGEFAVPNYLTSRRINLKLITSF